MLPKLEDIHLAVLGMGYVGLPLAVEFAKQRPVIGFDINARRVAELRDGRDRTREVSAEALKAAQRLELTDDPARLAAANVFIVTVPTPIDANKRPDLGALLSASRIVAPHLKTGAIVIYESTVYPGATEEDCVPVLEADSGLVCNRDFFVGYSPERMNPGDKLHTVADIVKVTSGSTPESAALIDALYASIVRAGTCLVSSIRVAEAAKVIENTQRDVNIALINELAVIFHHLGIDTEEVLKAAGSKWNFLPFRPGLVGGHCIGVDPYYLTHKAQAVGYHPQVVLAGRRMNDGMGRYLARRFIKAMIRNHQSVDGARVLILGLTFKENTPDVRNTRVVDIIDELREFNVDVAVHDPQADADEVRAHYGVELIRPEPGVYDGVIIAVAHTEFVAMGAEGIRALTQPGALVFDLKYVLPAGEADLKL